MDRSLIIATLREHQAELRRRGVLRAALFGSVARGEDRAGSDIDIFVDLDPDVPIGVFEYVGLTQYIGDLFPIPVDVANHARLKPGIRPQVERDAVYAF